MSHIDVRNPSKFGLGKEGVHKLAAYIAKYRAKEMDCRDLDQKRYFVSRGISKPEMQSWPIASVTALGAVQTAFAIAELGLLDGARFWYNKALNLIWIATPPYVANNFNAAPF